MRTLTQETTKPQITISASDSNDALERFMSKYKEYLEGKVYILQPGNNRAINAKQNIIGDREKTKELIAAVKEYGGVLSIFPSPAKFLFPAANVASQGYKLLILHEEDIEDGGPQPRLHILDDPIRLAKVNAIADSIEIEGQREPIDVYPSPSGNGKYRVCEGRMRHTAIFKILKVQGRKGTDGRVIDYILAFCKNRTELEAWEDALILQDKEGLTPYELGLYINGLPQRFPEIYSPNRHGFSFQETVAKRLAMDRTTVSKVLSEYRELSEQSQKVSPEISAQCTNLGRRVVEEAKKAPEEIKPSIYEAIVRKDLTTAETKKLVEVTKGNSSLSKEDIDAEAERIKNEKAEASKPKVEQTQAIAQELVDQGEKDQKRVDRYLNKVINAGSAKAPEDLMEKIYGHLAVKAKAGKVEEVDANAYATLVFGRLYERASQEEIEKIFEEVDGL